MCVCVCVGHCACQCSISFDRILHIEHVLCIGHCLVISCMAWMAGFELLAVLGLLGLLALSSMACFPRSDDDLPLADNSARLDAMLAIGIASLEQMQRIHDDTWQGASTDSDDGIDDSVLANLQLPTSTESTIGGVDPPADLLSPGAMWGLIAAPCTAPESPFMPSSETPSRASPHTPPAAHRRFCFPHWTPTSTQSSAQRARSAAHAVTPVDPVETPAHSRVPMQVEPVGRQESDEGSGAPVDRGRDSGTPAILCHDPIEATPAMWSGEGILNHDPIATPGTPDRADVMISPTIPVFEVNDDGSKRRKLELDKGTFGEACPSEALLASQQLLEHAHESLRVVPRRQTQVAYRSQSLDSLKSVMFDVWGFSDFRGMQAQVLTEVLLGRDVVACLQTGAGKSMLFQLPAVRANGVSVVLSPLSALMHEQIKALHAKGISAGCLGAGVGKAAEKRTLLQLGTSQLRVLYLSPERMLGLSSARSPQRRVLLDVHAQGRLQQIVVDEAHCITQWGLHFRPAYRRLSVMRDWFPGVPFLALTATATQRVVDDIVRTLCLREEVRVVASCRRPNLALIASLVKGKAERVQRILELVSEMGAAGRGIVFVSTRKAAAELAETLAAKGVPAAHFHGGMKQRERSDALSAWQVGTKSVMVATVAFGMGIDQPDVRLVVHMTPPSSLERYEQEAGRAGRDGGNARCVCFYSEPCLRMLVRVAKSAQEKTSADEVVAFVRDTSTCRQQSLELRSGILPMDVGPACGECDVCEPWKARRPRLPRRPRSAVAGNVGRKLAAKACPKCRYALRVCHGKFGWFRACSKRGSGCNYTRDLSPAGFAKLPASARKAVGSAQPARTFFRVHAHSVLIGGRAVASGCRGV